MVRIRDILLLFLVTEVIQSSVIVKRETGVDRDGAMDHEHGQLTPDELRKIEERVEKDGVDHTKEEEIQKKEQICDDLKKEMEEDGKAPIFTDENKHCQAQLSEASGRKKRSFFYNKPLKWTKCIIPYTIDEGIPANEVVAVTNNVNAAIKEYEDNTGFRFEPYTGDNIGDYGIDHEDYLRFIFDSKCYSYVGRIGFGAAGQNISACGGLSAVHEIGHALGLSHEQQNPNSLHWLYINYANIKPDYVRWYLRGSYKDAGGNESTSFDIGSNMQYRPYAFNLNGQRTMNAYDKDLWEVLTNNYNTYYMYRDLQNYHECFAEANCPTDLVCHNGGYRSIINGVCQCKCPKYFDSTTNCATLLNSGCGFIKEFDASESSYTFTSPSYPGITNARQSCLWHFSSPAGTRIQLDFTDFNIPPYDPVWCYQNEHVELNIIEPGTPGIKTCASSYEKTMWSVDNYLSVIYETNGWWGRGFDATVTVIKDEDKCYAGDGSDGSYEGSVDYAKNFARCVPWSSATSCSYHQFDSRAVNADLTGSECRNVGIGPEPWCYTNAATCERQTCDSCMSGSCFDIGEDCSALAANTAYCDTDAGKTNCMNTCGLCATHQKKTRGTCPDPGAVNGIDPDSTMSAYTVGDEVEYTCPSQPALKRSRVCTSEGTWSNLNFVCGFCPSGFSVFNERCFKWLGYKLYLNYPDAVSACSAYGADLVKVDSQEVQDYTFGLLNYNPIENGLDTWIGLTTDSSRIWKFADGVTASYTNWLEGEPGSTRTCAGMRASDGQWVDRNCNKFTGSVVCEFFLEGADSVVEDQLTNCEALITSNPNMCTVWTDYAWHNCRKICRNQ